MTAASPKSRGCSARCARPLGRGRQAGSGSGQSNQNLLQVSFQARQPSPMEPEGDVTFVQLPFV